ncbi:MAG: radical SAM protein [Vulcanimicrobiota bacterium]
MFVSPSFNQRKMLLGNIELRDRGSTKGGRSPGRSAERDRCSTQAGSEQGLGTAWRLSPFTFLFRRKDYSVFYHSLGLNKIFGDERLAKLHEMGKSGQLHGTEAWKEVLASPDGRDVSGDLSLLIDGRFLIPEGVDPFLPLAGKQGQCSLKKPHIGLLYLLITNECNLRCGYCSIESPVRKPQSFIYHSMTAEMARRGVDLFFEVLNPSAREPRVFYYGGEPLLNWIVFQDSLSYIREKEEKGVTQGRKMDISLVCNGTLVTEENVKVMKALSLSASVSLDGMKHHHDLMRVFRRGGGSWEDSLRGYFLIRKYTGRCGVSCTVGPHNLDDIEVVAEFFATRLECRGLGFNIMKGLPSGNSVEVSAEMVTRQLIKAYQVFRRYGIYEDRIMRKVSAFVNEEPWIHDCGGYGGQIALCADGVLGPCHIAADDHRFCWGHLDDRDIRDRILHSELTHDFCRRSPVTMKECFDCVGLGICGGGCAEEAYVKHGDIFALDRNFCIHCKTLIEWMCDDLAVKLRTSGELSL